MSVSLDQGLGNVIDLGVDFLKPEISFEVGGNFAAIEIEFDIEIGINFPRCDRYRQIHEKTRLPSGKILTGDV